MNIPKLEPVDRSREYNNYTQEQRDSVLYNYLFYDDKSHRKLDEEILDYDPEYSRGYQSMGILHHLGLKSQHKGIFSGMSIDHAIQLLEKFDMLQYQDIINSLKRYVNKEEKKAEVFNSWEIIEDSIALKTVDRSVFMHFGSGIPIPTRKFFEIEGIKPGQNINIELTHINKSYKAIFKMDTEKIPRTRLFWYSDFRDLLKNEFSKYYDFFKTKKTDDGIKLPKIRFKKITNRKYSVNLIELEEIELDIDSENTEENYNTGEKRAEGKIKYIYSKRYERDPRNRAESIAYHGCKCFICGFDFEKKYGQRGKGYIEIHHKNPLSDIGEEIVVDPKKDLIPVCSNCHRMIHRRKNHVLTIEEISKIIIKE